MTIKYWMISLLLVWIGTACSGRTGRSSHEMVSIDSLRYAQGFSIKRFEDHIQIEVRDPWNKSRILQRYLLVDRHKPIPSGLPQGTLVRTPLRHMVCYSSVLCGTLDILDVTDRIIGVCESRYVDVPYIREGIQKGSIADLGKATAPDIEKMIEYGAEVIIASPFENAGYGPAEKLGIPIIECADYMEATPLGRAEWIRFHGILQGKEAYADAVFKETERHYLQLKERVQSVPYRPTVVFGKKFGSVWHTPGGNSYMAHMFEDAGATYCFATDTQTGGLSLSFETVFDRAIHADFWLMKYNRTEEMSYADLQNEYTPYSNFDAFKKRNIFTCNTQKVAYHEEFPMRPDYLLENLIGVFHPQLLPGYSPRYYRKMQE